MLRQLRGDAYAPFPEILSHQSPRGRQITRREVASADDPRRLTLRPSALHSSPDTKRTPNAAQARSVAVVVGRSMNTPESWKPEDSLAARLGEILLDARGQSTPEARERYLDQACGNDPALRAQVVSLLEAEAAAGDFLGQTALGDLNELEAEGPGTRIGPYTLLEKIGEGGFGTVYVAEQEKPIQRRVALKIIKLGMDTRQVVARFEAERQALALMDHPNIAQVFDAGATESGRPYFVMELVRGMKITEYCDQHRLSPYQRLELFQDICHAVQHAHQKGIIHRDLKPSNILVAQHDTVAVPKVIDFGIAKATQGRLTEKTLYTGWAQMVGTPVYMSPEQADFSGLDVDTRSDIYSLGVLLYELLTGRTPFEQKNRAAGRARGDPATDPRGGTATPEHPVEQVDRGGAGDGGADARRATAQVDRVAARRPGLDRDEMSREGPVPPLRDGQWPGPGPGAAPGPRTDPGPTTHQGLPVPEMGTAKSRCVCDGQRRGGGRRDDRRGVDGCSNSGATTFPVAGGIAGGPAIAHR